MLKDTSLMIHIVCTVCRCDHMEPSSATSQTFHYHCPGVRWNWKTGVCMSNLWWPI